MFNLPQVESIGEACAIGDKILELAEDLVDHRGEREGLGEGGSF